LFAQLATGLAGQQASGESTGQAAGKTTGCTAAKQLAKKFVLICRGVILS
jgi:hypothetical protein